MSNKRLVARSRTFFCSWRVALQRRAWLGVALRSLSSTASTRSSSAGTTYTRAAFPAENDVLSRVAVTYETLPGWAEDISGARTWEQLPAAARAYVLRMEAVVGVECRYIGVGPGRDAIVIKPTGAR